MTWWSGPEGRRVHDIHCAVEVGSVEAVVAAAELRPRIIAALQQGLGTSES